jgi:rare lipoprotein A
LDQPAQAVQTNNRQGYVRIDPRQMASVSPSTPSRAPRTSAAPVQSVPVQAAPVQAAPVRSASRTPATPVTAAPTRAPQPAAQRPSTARPTSQPTTSVSPSPVGSDVPAPELAMFEELAPFASNPSSNEAAPWQKIGAPYEAGGVWYIPAVEPDYDETGRASWYGPGFHGRTTANGELFDQTVPTAAHPTLPIPSFVEVTNLANGNSLVVRVNDRGPFTGDRVIDLSARAAELLDFKAQGTTDVRVRFIGPAPATPLVTAANLAPAPSGGAPRPVTRTTVPRTPTAQAASASTASPPRGTPAAAAPASQPRREANGTGTTQSAAAPRSNAATTPVARQGTRTVQLGAFASRANAERAQREARDRGSVSIEETNANGRRMFRVILTTSETAATAAPARSASDRITR